MIIIKKPAESDLKLIKPILRRWTEKKEADKYLKRIKEEIVGQTKFNMRFWVAEEAGIILGAVGLADPVPKVLPLVKTKYPGEIKILYIGEDHLGLGVGSLLVDFIEKEARKIGYTELLVRSAQKYQNTAWGFYNKLNYARAGMIPGGDKSKMMQVFRKKLTHD